MNKKRILLIAVLAVATFLVVYSPHYRYHFPSHIDEWHHITECLKLASGEYILTVSAYRIGFHIILFILSRVTNLVIIYQFLPALWASITGLILFLLVYKKTGNQFHTAWFAMLFFASIKSNVNITGLWFFTPLTFSIPLVYLYVYFFTEGVEKRNRKFILISIGIMLALLFIHAISVLFALIFLAIYSVVNIQYFKKERSFFLYFLAFGVIGATFFEITTKLPLSLLAQNLINSLQFKRGWGVLELKNSLFELYSFSGYFLACVGALFALRKENLKKYLAYLMWPLSTLLMIHIYRKTGVSYLSPYQRNLYYFAISMPLLSALGLNYILDIIKRKVIDNINFNRNADKVKKICTVLILIAVIAFTFKSYWYIPKNIDLYQVINENNYRAIRFLATIKEKSVVMALPSISVAIYPISQHTPVATFFFYGPRDEVELFFRTKNCAIREKLAQKNNVKYVLSTFPIECGWKLLYDLNNYIYQID